MRSVSWGIDSLVKLEPGLAAQQGFASNGNGIRGLESFALHLTTAGENAVHSLGASETSEPHVPCGGMVSRREADHYGREDQLVLEKKALLVLDAQVAMFNLSKPLHSAEAVLGNIKSLIDAARSAGSPIVYIQHSGSRESVFARGSAGWQIHTTVAPNRSEIVMEKHTADAFNGTDLAECLERLSVGAIAICGFVTEGCVDTTVRRASSLGFQVELAADAHSTTDGQVLRAEQIIEHHNSVLAIFGEVKATDEIQFSLGGGVQWGNVEAEGPPGT